MRLPQTFFVLAMTFLGLGFTAHAESTVSAKQLEKVKKLMLTRVATVEVFEKVAGQLHELLSDRKMNDSLAAIVEQTLQVTERSNYSEYKVAVVINDTMPTLKATIPPQLTLALLKLLANAKSPNLVAAHGVLAFQAYMSCNDAVSPIKKFFLGKIDSTFCQEEVVPYLQQMMNLPFEDSIARRRNISAYMSLSGLVSNSGYKAPDGFESQLTQTTSKTIDQSIKDSNNTTILQDELAARTEFLLFSQIMEKKILDELKNSI